MPGIDSLAKRRGAGGLEGRSGSGAMVVEIASRPWQVEPVPAADPAPLRSLHQGVCCSGDLGRRVCCDVLNF